MQAPEEFVTPKVREIKPGRLMDEIEGAAGSLVLSAELFEAELLDIKD